MVAEQTKVEAAVMYSLDNFRSGLSCTESVYDALLRSGIIDAHPDTRALCAGFGGGIGLAGLTCGALSGAVLAVGAKYGRKDPHALSDSERASGLYEGEYRRYNRMAADFAARNGSCLCREITVPHQNDWFGDARRELCAGVVANAVGLACRYLELSPDEAALLSWGENMASQKN